MDYQIKWSGTTTDSSETEVYQASSTRLTLSTGDVLRIQGTVVAIKPSTTTTKEWEYSALIKNSSGTVSFVGDPIVTDVRGDTGTDSWLFTIVADNINKAFVPKVTGQSSTTIDWNIFGNYGDTSSSVSPTAPTIKTQIDSLIGSGITSAEYNPWVEAGARTIVDILKPEDLQRHSTAIAVPSSGGLNVVLYRIWRVLVGGQLATQRDEGQLNQVIDSNSFYKASAFTPVYIVLAGILKCFNGIGQTIGTMIGIKYPTGIDTSVDTEIEGVPENLHYAVVLYAAIQGRIQQLTTLMKTTLAGLVRAVSVSPSSLRVPLFTYTTTATTIGSLGTPPTYSKPSIGTLPATLTIDELSIASIEIPTAPTLASVVYTDATGATISTATIGEIGAVPTYIPAVVPSEIEAGILEFNAKMADTVEDIELAKPHIEKVSVLIQQYQALVSEAQTVFNSAITKQKAEIDRLLQLGQMMSQRYLEQAKLTTDVSMQNKIQTMTALIQNNNSLLQKYQDDVTLYSQLVNARVSAYQSNIQAKVQVYTSNVKTTLDVWTLDIQNELNKYQKELAIYQSTVEVAVKNAEFALQKALQDGNQGLAKEIQEYDAYLKKYSAEVQKYQIDVQSILQGFQADVERTVQEHAGMLASQQQLQSEYHSLIDLYLGRSTQQQPQGGQ